MAIVSKIDTFGGRGGRGRKTGVIYMLGKKLGKNICFSVFSLKPAFFFEMGSSANNFFDFSVFLEIPLETEKKSQNRTFKNRVAGVLPLGVHRKHTNPKS